MSELKNNEFKAYLKEKFSIQFVYTEKKNKINKILPGEEVLKAEPFFRSLKVLDVDIDKECHNLYFKDRKWTKYKSDSFVNNRIKSFISTLTNVQEKIGKAAGIEKTRFNKIINGELEAYPYEIYGLAKCLNLKPSELFEHFYENKGIAINFSVK